MTASAEWRLQRVALLCWAASVAVAIWFLLSGWATEARLEVRIDALAERTREIERENNSLGHQLLRKGAHLDAVATEVREELKSRAKLDLAMAEVLARSKVLKEQHDRFEVRRQEVLEKLNRMDQMYVRARQAAPSTGAQ